MNVQSRGDYVIESPPLPSLSVRRTERRFPIHRVYCVGRNYAAHAAEMGHDPNREPPFFFQKNPDNINESGAFPYPPLSSDVQHEVELVVALKSGGDSIPIERALDCVYGYAVGLDMTRRDLQGEAKKLGRPWETGKAFEASAPCSAIVAASESGHPKAGGIRLFVNNQLRQEGDLSQLIWSVPEVISHLSKLFTLAAGDLIFTGTPSGVGAVKVGDRLLGAVDGVGTVELDVT
jgi:fumarylpyruvate hydrolase